MKKSGAGIKISATHRTVEDAAPILQVFGTPLTNAWNSEPIRLHCVQLNDLDIPSGQIVARDGYIPGPEPFTRKIKPGAYPLTLIIAAFNTDERIAFALLRFSDEPLATWEMALCEGQDASTLKEDEIFGYGVDSGTGCFADAGAYESLADASDDKTFDRIEKEMKTAYKNTRSWVRVQTSKGSIAIFYAGFGDGTYASYFGLNAAGQPVALATDFGLVDWPRRPRPGAK